MGWLTDLSNVAVGAIERDREITKEDLAIRAENLQANKEILIKQKEYKWAKELSDYENEKVKFDQLEAANEIFKIDGNDYNYAIAALPIVTPNWKVLDKDTRRQAILDFKGETFDWSLEGNRDEINKKAAMEMTAINDIVAKQIKEAKGDSFLIKQILRKKDSAEKNILDSIESKLEAAETIKLTERKLNPENVGLAVQVGSGTSDDRAWTKFQKSELGKLWVAKFLKEQDESRFKKITAKDNFNDILKFLDVKELTNEGNFTTDGYDVKIEGMNDATRALFDTYKSVYFAVWNSIDMKELWARGVPIQDLSKEVNANVIQKQIYQVVESRWFKESFDGTKGKDQDFMGVLPLNIVPLDLENVNYGQLNNVDMVDIETGHKLDTKNLTAPNKIFTVLYQNFLNAKQNEKDGIYYKKSFSAIQTAMAKGADQQLINDYKIYVGQNFEKIAKQLGITDYKLDNKFSLENYNGEISLIDSTTNKAVSLAKLKEEGKLKAIIEKYPWIENDPNYIAWLKTQEQ